MASVLFGQRRLRIEVTKAWNNHYCIKPTTPKAVPRTQAPQGPPGLVLGLPEGPRGAPPPAVSIWLSSSGGSVMPQNRHSAKTGGGPRNSCSICRRAVLDASPLDRGALRAALRVLVILSVSACAGCPWCDGVPLVNWYHRCGE